MTTLRIEHEIRDYSSWKAAFDSDPLGRQQSGVRRYRVFQPVDDPQFVLIDLDFDDSASAQGFLARMRKVWARVDGTVMMNPRTRIVEPAESKEY